MKYEITYRLNGKRVVTNVSDDNIQLVVPDGHINRVELKAYRDVVLEKTVITYYHEFKDLDCIFCNGFQSWTDTKEYSIEDRLNNLHQVPALVKNLYSFKSYGDIAFYDYKKNTLHGHDVAYIRGTENIFIGNNNFQFAGLIIEFQIKDDQIALISDVNNYPLYSGDQIVLFDFDFQEFNELSEVTYFNKWKPRTTKKLLGYSSWYNHFENINEEIVYQNLAHVYDNFDLFQIDDGYESKVGDWMECDPVKFPNGLAPIVKKIKEKGIMPGIWIAPFVAAADSKLAKEHPDWLKKDDNEGKLIKGGCNWGGFYPIDIYNVEARKYIKQCLLFYKDLGFEFFKLDFLYAVSLPAYKGKNRSEVAYEAYRFLRETLEDSLILGNGCLMAPAFGLFDYVRIGCSVTTEWDDSWLMQKMHRERNSTKTAIQNTIYRDIFNGKVFLSDPDVFLLRDENMTMNKDQRFALAVINALFGSVLMTSDDIGNYDEEKKKVFDDIVYLSKNAKNAKYRKVNNLIEISYVIDGARKHFTYDWEIGKIYLPKED